MTESLSSSQADSTSTRALRGLLIAQFFGAFNDNAWKLMIALLAIKQVAASTDAYGPAFELASQMALRLRKTSQKVGNLAFMDVTGRVARTLIDLSKEPDAMTHPDGMQIRITRQELGRIVGCSREMVGRVLKNLEEQGLITAKGKTMVVFNTR